MNKARTRYTIKIILLSLVVTCILHETSCKSRHRLIIKKVSDYDSLNQLYDSVVAQYAASQVAVDRLESRNVELDSQVKKKDREISFIKTNLQKLEHKAIAGIQIQNSTLKEELKKAEETNATLKELGSILHVSNIRLYPLHMSKNGDKVRIGRRGRKMNTLRMYFDIDQNYVADEGSKTLFIVITAPDGNLVRDE